MCTYRERLSSHAIVVANNIRNKNTLQTHVDRSSQNVLPLSDMTAASSRTVDAFQALLTLHYTIEGFRLYLKWSHPSCSFFSTKFPFDHLHHVQSLTLGNLLALESTLRILNPYFRTTLAKYRSVDEANTMPRVYPLGRFPRLFRNSLSHVPFLLFVSYSWLWEESSIK